MMYYSFRSAQMPHSKVLVFCDAPIRWNFLLTFDATLGAKNYGANHLYPHVSYIFGKPWACSSTWWNPGWVILLENLSNSLFSFSCFPCFFGFQHRAPDEACLKHWIWPFELFHWIFACFHIDCDRYTSDYAHLTVSNTVWPLSISRFCRTES